MIQEKWGPFAEGSGPKLPEGTKVDYGPKKERSKDLLPTGGEPVGPLRDGSGGEPINVCLTIIHITIFKFILDQKVHYNYGLYFQKCKCNFLECHSAES